MIANVIANVIFGHVTMIVIMTEILGLGIMRGKRIIVITRTRGHVTIIVSRIILTMTSIHEDVILAGIALSENAWTVVSETTTGVIGLMVLREVNATHLGKAVLPFSKIKKWQVFNI
jgi:hypothetical protein